MTFAASQRSARVLGAIRFLLLAVGCLAVAHDAVFAAEYGLGGGFVRAMSEGGHDGYWPVFTVVATSALTLLGLWSAVRIGRLVVSSGPSRPSVGSAEAVRSHAHRSAPAYRTELRRLWLALFALTTTAFAVQENVEHLAGHHHLIGLGALVGPEYPLALPVIGLVTFAAAAIGAAVRWRIAVLEHRLAGRLHRPLQRGLAARHPAPGWLDVAAAVAHGRILVRLDAGRAPPDLA